LFSLRYAVGAIAATATAVSAAPTLFEQGPIGPFSSFASDSNDPSMFTQADNFTLNAPSFVTGITFSGDYQSVAEHRDDSFTIAIHSDDGGLPAAVPLFQTTTAALTRAPTGPARADYEAEFASPVTLGAGDYWLAIQNATSDPGSSTGRWGWSTVNNDGVRARIFGFLSPDWELTGTGDLVFSICGFERALATHFWDFEGNGRDHVGLADGTPGGNVQYSGPDGSPARLFALGQALTADASGAVSDQIVVPTGAYTRLRSSDFTISLAYKRGIGDTGAMDQDALLTVVGGGGWRVRTLGDAMNFVATSSGAQVTSDPVSFDPNGEEWRHFAIVCDRDGMTTWYVDGVESGVGLPSSMIGSLSSLEDLYIGGASFLGVGLDGSMDRLRIYHAALAPAQVRALAREVVEFDEGCETDFNSDGVTNSFDLATLLAAWGACP